MFDPNTPKIRKEIDEVQGSGFDTATHSLANQGLKCVQRGTVELSSTTVNVTITEVVLNKSYLNFSFSTTGSTVQASNVSGELTTTTNILFSRSSSGYICTISWEVIEWR